MRYYVEGSVTGPESFTKKTEALAYAEATANRFGVITEVFDSTTHEPLRGNTGQRRTGAPFMTFRPKPKAGPLLRQRQLDQIRDEIDESHAITRAWAEIQTSLLTIDDEEEWKAHVAARLAASIEARKKAYATRESVITQVFAVMPENGRTVPDLYAGMPTPALIDACNDGLPHWARTATYPDSPGFIQWRLRDDHLDPKGTEYHMVRVIRL